MSDSYKFSFQEYHEQEYEMGEHSRMKTSQTPQGKKKKTKKTEIDIGKFNSNR